MSKKTRQAQTSISENIIKRIPRLALGEFPTPLIAANKLQMSVGGPEIWLKRDDLITFGLGGNKVRGLEVMLADALAKGADTLVTGAGIQSNHVRATAAAAAYAGMHCTAVYWGEPPLNNDGNYRVTQMLGADCEFTRDNDRASVDTFIVNIANELNSQGRRTYQIPRGGACAMGALGHVLAVIEMNKQCKKLGYEPDAIVFALGSGGTYAGWLLGIKLLELPWKLEAYSVSREPREVSSQVAKLATEAAELLGYNLKFNREDVPVHGGFIGDGYGMPSIEGKQAIELLARTEGILLDPTYTGKAMADYLDGVKRGGFKDYSKVIFIHTGGEPAFFAGDGHWLQ